MALSIAIMKKKRVKQILEMPKSKFEIYLGQYWKGFKKFVREYVFKPLDIISDYTLFYVPKDKLDKKMHLILILCLLTILYVSARMN